MSEEAQVSAMRSQNFVNDGRGDAVGAEPPYSQEAAVGNKPFYRFFFGHPLVGHGPGLTGKKFPGFVRIRIHEKRIGTLIHCIHNLRLRENEAELKGR
jgi:hypothetical protein